MRSLARPVLAATTAWPLLVSAQGTGAAQTGRSAWNWAIGIAALVVVLVLARLIFAKGRPGGGGHAGRGREPHRYA